MQKRRTQFLLVLFWGNVQPCGLFLLKSHRTIYYQNCFQKNILIVITNIIHYIHKKKKKIPVKVMKEIDASTQLFTADLPCTHVSLQPTNPLVSQYSRGFLWHHDHMSPRELLHSTYYRVLWELFMYLSLLVHN